MSSARKLNRKRLKSTVGSKNVSKATKVQQINKLEMIKKILIEKHPERKFKLKEVERKIHNLKKELNQ